MFSIILSPFQQADIGFGDLSITADRLEQVQFLYPYTIDTVTFVTPLPKSVMNYGFIYQVFEPMIWISIIISLLAIIIITYLGKLFFMTKRWTYIIWQFIQILFNQTITSKIPFHPFVLLLLYTWVLSCLFLKLIYSNCLYTFMVLPKQIDKIDTIQQLYQALIKNQISLTLLEESSYTEALKVFFY